MSLKRLHQLFMAEEATEATPLATLFTAGNGSYQVINPELEYDAPRYERQINQGSLTRLQGLSGIRSASLKFGLELTGTNAFFSVPQIGLPLRACGFRQETLVAFTIGAITGGPFRHGETVTQTTSGATGVVVQDTYTGQTTIWLANQNGLGNGTAFTSTALLTGGSSGATATPTGFAIRLTTGTVTGTPVVGQVANQATSSASGVITSHDTTNGIMYVRQTSAANFNATNLVTVTTSLATFTPSAVSTQVQAGYGWWPQSYSLSRLATTGAGLTNAIADGDLLRSGDAVPAYFYAVGAHADAGAPQFVYVRRISGNHATATSTAFTNVTQGNEAFISSSSATLVESQFQIPSLSMGIAKDGVRESLKFGRGNVSASGTLGEPMILSFEFKGGYYAVADLGNVPSVSFAQTTPPVLLDADLALGHSSTTYANEFIPCIEKLDWSMGNEIAFLKCMADAAGITNTHITGRKPIGSFDPDLNPEVVWSVLNDFLENTSYRARFSVGSAIGNRFLFSAPALSTTAAPTADRDGVSTRQIAFELTGGSQQVSALNTENELVIIAPYV